jgi:DNA-binding CsgD family transcriptional regulator
MSMGMSSADSICALPIAGLTSPLGEPRVPARNARRDAALAALDLWAHATIVVDAGRHIVIMNRGAETLLDRDDGLWLGRDGRLQAIDDARTCALDVAIRACAATAAATAGAMAPATDTGGAELDGIVLPRRSGREPLRATISPLPLLAGAEMPELAGGAALLMILDPECRPRRPGAWLARQFGLTPSEQRLAEAIINGVPLADAARQLGIQVSTARTRMKAIQVKTTCRRQIDLVRLALSLPQVR